MADYTITLPPDAPVTSTGPTRAYIKEMARHFLDELAEGRLLDTTSGEFGLDAAVDEAVTRFYKEAKCAIGEYSEDTVAETSTYEYSSFDPAERLFEVYSAIYEDNPIRVLTVDELNGLRPGWRSEPSGTPVALVPWDEMRFRLYPTPSAIGELTIEGYLGPDLVNFTEDTDHLPLHQSRAMTIAAGTAVLVAIRFANVPESQIQKSDCYGIWKQGIADANREIHGVAVPVVGSMRRNVSAVGTGETIPGLHNYTY